MPGSTLRQERKVSYIFMGLLQPERGSDMRRNIVSSHFWERVCAIFQNLQITFGALFSGEILLEGQSGFYYLPAHTMCCKSSCFVLSNAENKLRHAHLQTNRSGELARIFQPRLGRGFLSQMRRNHSKVFDVPAELLQERFLKA